MMFAMDEPKRTRVERGLYVKGVVYYACAPDSNGKMVWKSLGKVSLIEARDLRSEFALKMRKTTQRRAPKLTVTQVADLWQEEIDDLVARGQLRPRTGQAHEEALRLHIKPLLGPRKIGALGVEDLEEWHRALQTLNLATWSIRRYWVTLRQMLSYAVREGHIIANPADLLDPRKVPKIGKRQVRYLEKPQIEALLAHASSVRYRIALMLGIFCGLRRGEAVALRWSEVSFTEGVVRVTGQIVYQKIDGKRTAIRVPYLKSDAGYREITLPKALLLALTAYQGNAEPDTYVLGGDVPLEVANLRRDGVVPAGERAGLDVTFHVLRHTFASILIAQGEDAKYVADQLGHDKPSITYDVYTHLFNRARHADGHRDGLDAEFGEIIQGVAA